MVVCVFFMAGGVLAYLSDADRALNVLEVGGNTITAEEEFEQPGRGKKTVKKPTAVNTGSNDCYVRARVVLSDSRAADYLTYYNNSTAGFNTASWVEDGDGWMYYKYILKTGEKSDPVFTHIELSHIPDSLLGFTIDVVFESVQSEGFDNARDAFESLEKGGGQ